MRADGASLSLGVVEAAASVLFELQEHALVEQSRRDVDLEVELTQLGLEVGVRDRLERRRVDERRIAGVIGEVELDLESERPPFGVKSRLREHPREDIKARTYLAPVSLAVLATERFRGDLLTHAPKYGSNGGLVLESVLYFIL